MPLIRDLLKFGRDDSHPSWRLSTKPQRRRGCHSPKTWLIDVRCRMQIDLQLSFVTPQGWGETERGWGRGRQKEIMACLIAMAAGILEQWSLVLLQWQLGRVTQNGGGWGALKESCPLRWLEFVDRTWKLKAEWQTFGKRWVIKRSYKCQMPPKGRERERHSKSQRGRNGDAQNSYTVRLQSVTVRSVQELYYFVIYFNDLNFRHAAITKLH